MKNMIDSKRIRLGKITYFDVEHNGSLVPSVNAFVYMINFNGTYVNPFNLAMDLPVYDRVPYANVTKSGDDYGTKIRHVQGEIKNGPCVVLERIDLSEYFGHDYMSIDMLKECMLQSNKYFVDRASVFEDEISNNKKDKNRKKYVFNKLLDDKVKEENLNVFMRTCGEEEIHHTR